MRKYVERINTAITVVFYALFLTTPLAMHPATSELFEFNKMWLVYIYSLIILFLWGTKMIVNRKIEVRRTFFDIPLLLFLSSQIISTVFSLDIHTSFWGYYSRFNGGLLSSLCYVFLYFAFATNILTSEREENIKRMGKMLFAILLSGILVALWGLPSHFGYDPTCLVFRGTFDVSCWTDAFQPKIRMFSTLGQPNWLAAFLLILIPIGAAFLLNSAKGIKKNNLLSINVLKSAVYLFATLLFYFDLDWTLSQSGFIGFWIGELAFAGLFTLLVFRKGKFSVISILKQKAFLLLAGLQVAFLLITFFTQNPIPSLNKYEFSTIMQSRTQKQNITSQQTTKPPEQKQAPAQPALEAGITGSGDIRKIVWKGAIEIWKAYPLFGSGVETYAFAYYKFRPVEHNLTSEWDYLYNKAHNEFLDYLATTGAYGLGSYLLYLGTFLFFGGRHMISQIRKRQVGNPILPALIGAFIGIQVSNFFGFSVVIVNLLMFLIPLFYWAYAQTNPSKVIVIPSGEEDSITSQPPGNGSIMVIIALGVICIYSIFYLVNYWNADINYALGNNYDRVNEFQQANPYLEKAVQMQGGEELYKNELSVNLAALALTAAQQKDNNSAAQFATRSKELSDEVVRTNPNNVVYWKARTRVMFSLAELSPPLMSEAVNAIVKAHELAPTDAKVLYNEALIYEQVGQRDKALQFLDETIKVKMDYRDAYYAKALFLSQLADEEKKDKTKKTEYKKEAIDTLNFLLKNVAPSDQQAKDLLKSLE